jgi:hypothetical protein
VTARYWLVEYLGRTGWQSVGFYFQTRHAAETWVAGIEPADRRAKYRARAA